MLNTNIKEATMLRELQLITGHRKKPMINALDKYYFSLFGTINPYKYVYDYNLPCEKLFVGINKMLAKIREGFKNIEGNKKAPMNKTLVFEGAGWDIAENNGVGNCRIRTRFLNDDNRPIYLEMSGTKVSKNMSTYVQHLHFSSHITHCFYDDVKEGCNQKSEIRKHETGLFFEYTKENIIKFVNNKLNGSFTDLKVINKGLCVHDTKETLC